MQARYFIFLNYIFDYAYSGLLLYIDSNNSKIKPNYWEKTLNRMSVEVIVIYIPNNK